MALARVIIALVLVGVFLVAGASAVDEALADSGQTVEITGETLDTGTTGTIEELNQSKISSAFYDETVTIQNSTGATMNEGEDYEWFPKNGTFKVTSSALASETGVSVDYSYSIPNQNQQQIASTVGQYFDVLAPLAFFFLVVAALIGGAARLGGV